MIPAKRNELFTRWFVNHARARLFRQFGSIQVAGLDEVASVAEQSPVLVVSNHTAWWDPLLILFLAVRVLGLDAYAMMDARNLRRLPFFARVGAFGVDLEDPFDGARSVRYATKLLDAPRRLVWLFPQGREVPVTARPLRFRGGSAEIARLSKRAVVIPAGIRYEHGSAERPAVYVSFGSPLAPERDIARAREAHESAVTRQLDVLDALLVAGQKGDLVELHRTKPSVLQGVAERSLSLLSRLL